jgi:hypothetical protein
MRPGLFVNRRVALVDWLGRPVPPPPAGRYWLEWIGDQSPMQDPFIEYKMARGGFTPEQVAVIRAMTRDAVIRVNNTVSLSMVRHNGPGGQPGLSQDYTFGPRLRARPGDPGSYVQHVTSRDLEILVTSPNGHQFTHIGAPDEDLLIQPPAEIVFTNRQQFKDYRAFARAALGS